MPDEESEREEREVEFIDAKTDAEYRLECLRLALATHTLRTADPAGALAAAKEYYSWIMELETEGQAEPGPATTEEPCKPRPH